MKNYRLIIICFCCVIHFSSKSQCNTKTYSTSSAIIIESGIEELYSNPRLERGIQIVSASTFIQVSKENKNDIMLKMMVSFTKTRYQDLIVPRRIFIRFSNGSSKRYVADTYQPVTLSEFLFHRCYFQIPSSDLNMFLNQGVSSFTIIDNRTSKQLATKPYVNLFKEQFQCITKAYTNEYGNSIYQDNQSRTRSNSSTTDRNYNSNLRGTVKVYTCSNIYPAPEKSKRYIEKACDGEVEIIGQFNKQFYKVKHGKTIGYISADMIRNNN